MALVRIFNPGSYTPRSHFTGQRIQNPVNPKKRKTWTHARAQDRKEKAEWAARELQGDDERGDEIAEMSVEEYAESRGVEIVNDNPCRGENHMMKKRVSAYASSGQASGINPTVVLAREGKLRQQIDELKKENESLQEKLDAVQEIVECDDDVECTAEDHLEEIADVLADGDGQKDDEDEEED
jgi:hypothetical protein